MDGTVGLRRRLVRDPAFVVAAGFVATVVLCAVCAPWLAPYDPLRQDLSTVLQGPSRAHWLGTDELGRDVLSRLLFAARISLGAAAIAVMVALALGFPLGILAGYRGGRLEAAVMRISDGLMAMPGLLIVIAVIGVVGNGVLPAMTALGVLLAPVLLRLTRGIVLGLRNEAYVDAVRVLGFRTPRVVGRHLLPHVVPALVVQVSLLLGAALLIEAGLSFVGLGVQPPEAGWGSMLSKGTGLYRRQSFVLVPPGVAITLTVLALNVIGDTLRDAVSPDGAVRDREPPRSPDPTVATAPVESPSANGPGPVLADRPPADPPALAIDGLTVEVPLGGRRWPAVTDVTLEVPRGRTVGLVGESGCGKTLTARSAIALHPDGVRVAAGSVVVAGQQLIGRPEPELCRIRGRDVAMVFQDPSSSLDPAFTVGDQIGESLRLHGGLSRRAARTTAAELLERVGIDEPHRRVRAYPHQLSGGMQQRVAIAAALACRPALLLADEPTSALDVTVQSEILALLAELQDEFSMGILLVTHDLGVVAEVCDSVVVMYAGQVVEAAPVDALFRAPSHPYSRALLATQPTGSSKGRDLPAIPGRVPALDEMPAGCRFAARCDHVREACSDPIPLRRVDGTAVSRCVLAESVAHR